MKKTIIAAGLTIILSGLFFSQASEGLAAPLPKVRVLIAGNEKSFRLTVKGAYTIKALPSLQVLKKGQGLAGASLVMTPTGLKLGNESLPARGIRIEPAAERDLYLNKSRFRGFIDIHKNANGTLYAINHLGMEGYLYGVLHHEVAPWWPMDALRAQAIAARTYALYQVQVSKVQEFDLKSSTSSQVYGGSTSERYRTKRAVDQTAGKVLTYAGKVFPAYFHATCAGLTAAAKELWKIDLPPLAGNAKCGYCRISPHYYWEAKVPLSEIEEKMNKNGRPVGQILKIEVISQTPSARVGSLRITGTSQETVMAAKDFRIWVGGDRIRSTSFAVEIREDMAEFHGKGWGHGVGLCQWGAFGQSLLGHSYEKIIGLYYPGSKIVNYESQ